MRIANLAEYKEKNEFTNRELARNLDISEAYLSQILSGQRGLSKKLAKKISQSTGIPILNLLYPQGENHVGHQSSDAR